MAARPLVTALVTSHNYARYLPAAIDSALAQSYPELEVLVVDDGSTDASREILAGYGTRIRTVLQDAAGQAAAFNAGFAAARGAIVCFLDADDLWYADKVERAVEAHRGGAVLVCHDLDLVQENGERWPEASWCRATRTVLATGNALPELLASGAGWSFSPTSGMSITKAAAEALRPLPEADWQICADNPVAYGAAALGPVAALDASLGVYRVHGANQFALLPREDSWILRFRGVEDPARRLAYLQDFARRRGIALPDTDLRDRYYYCREWMFLTRRFPALDLPRLWRARLRSRREAAPVGSTLVRSLLWDSLAALGVSLGLPSPWSELRRRYAPRRSAAAGRIPPPLRRV